ncbi:hypothetical protein GPECTOR_12g595 [Gonium pectorale]|uniref:Choice-of-anchor I domain-containing protein n=1 Tax=Gonium pectorale TaxID=33097 RepID=A0A150GP97_GONPE|nr:hypothetical protein GPECTOR_12g595 [Gonium pectorale]|eukprot:KXZ51631.1 hypothetical protein GPECTOR_12g595 [Gonium pectorale]
MALLALLALALVAGVSGQTVPTEFSGCLPSIGISASRLSSFQVGNWTGTSSLEVLDYDPYGKLTAVVEARNSATTPLALLILNYADPARPVIHHRILVGNSAGEGAIVGTPNSVAVWNGYVALVLDGAPATAPGWVRIYHMASGAKVGEVQFPGCSMPDSVKWTKDGRRLVIACEGEPATQEVAGSDPAVDPNPVGAIGIVYVQGNGSFTPVGSACSVSTFALTPKLLDFQSYINAMPNDKYQSLLDRGFRIDPRLNKSSAGRDIEPEYIALHVNPNVQAAWASLQENNAIVSIDMKYGQERIKTIWPLGWKNWTRSRIDASDKDGPAKLRTQPGLYSWYQPDTITHAFIAGQSYLFMANEGDSKAESLRVKDLAGGLDPVAFPNASVKLDTELGRMTVDPLFGITGGYNASKAWNAQGPYSRLIGYGARSWSIFETVSGRIVYESGDGLESLMASHPAASLCFNCDRDKNEVDGRSDNAGPEPEAVEVFSMGNRTFAAIGLERMGGVVLYDVTNPRAPVLGGYLYNRDYAAPAATPTAQLGDLAPEGLKFVPASESNNGKAFLIASNEVSATVSAWQLERC